MIYIFVDESRIDKGRYMLYGSLFFDRNLQPNLQEKFWEIWDKNFPSRKSELKWTKVSKNKLKEYKKFVNLFFSFRGLKYYCLILDKHSRKYQSFQNNTEILGVYRYLCQFIFRNVNSKNKYQIFIDSQNYPSEAGTLDDLKTAINNLLNHKTIRSVEAVPDSKKSPEIQIVDIFTGAVGYALEGFDTSKAKLELVNYLRKKIVGSSKFKTIKFQTGKKQKSAPFPNSLAGKGVH